MQRVLLVDDEYLVRQLACDDLIAAGYEVVSASTGDEAYKIVAAGARFDFLITDIRMPGQIDGWELGRLVKRQDPLTKVIYTTGYSAVPSDVDQADHIVQKPYVVGDLCRIMAARE